MQNMLRSSIEIVDCLLSFKLSVTTVMLFIYLIKHDADDRIRLAAGARARRCSADSRVQSAVCRITEGKSKPVEALPISLAASCNTEVP
jgi:hypothetical protein